MSDAIYQAKTSGLGAKNDALREAFERDGIRCFLLRREGETSAFTVITEVLTGWQRKWNEYRNALQLKIATIDDEFENQISITTHFACGVPDADDEIEVFEIAEGSEDIIAPTGSSVYWKVYGQKTPHLRYELPEVDPDPEP